MSLIISLWITWLRFVSIGPNLCLSCETVHAFSGRLQVTVGWLGKGNFTWTDSPARGLTPCCVLIVWQGSNIQQKHVEPLDTSVQSWGKIEELESFCNQSTIDVKNYNWMIFCNSFWRGSKKWLSAWIQRELGNKGHVRNHLTKDVIY